MPSSFLPDSNQRLTVGLKPLGKASRPKTLLNWSCRAVFALLARNTFGEIKLEGRSGRRKVSSELRKGEAAGKKLLEMPITSPFKYLAIQIARYFHLIT